MMFHEPEINIDYIANIACCYSGCKATNCTTKGIINTLCTTTNSEPNTVCFI